MPITLRPATPDDADVLAHHRAGMFRDMGRIAPHAYDALHAASRAYFLTAIPTGEYVAWVACPADSPTTVVGGGGVQIRHILPRPTVTGQALLSGPEGLVVNVYTDAHYRRQGVGEALMRQIITWSEERGIGRLVLHASEQGRGLYERLGFTASNEMILSRKYSS